MDDLNDHELLAEFVRNGSETAFGALVARYVNLVYSVAMRSTGNPDSAREISQVVFIILARKAGSMRPGTILSGWLYQAARLTAANFVKGEIRRQNREQEAYMQSTLNEPEEPAWEEIAPLLDEAMGALGETDRTALVLRYFENKSAAEIGTSLHLSEAAAHMRVRRALEKLRKNLTRHGVSSSAEALAGAISSNSVQVAPALLAKVLTAGAIAGGVTASGSTLTLIKGAMKIMAWTKVKTTVVTAAVLLLASGTAVVAVNQYNSIRSKAALASMQGDWEGVFSGGGVRMRLIMKIVKTNDAYRATLDSIDQGAKNIALTVLSARPDSIHVALPTIDADYQASFSADKTEMTGTWKQMNGSFPLTFKKTTEADRLPAPMVAEDYAPRAGSDLQGAWDGAVNIGQIKLRLDLKISESATGDFRAEMDSVDQGARNLPITALTYQKPQVRFTMEQIDAVFEGNRGGNGDELKGTWTQMGKKFPLTFRRATATEATTVPEEKNYGSGADYQVEGHWKGTLSVNKMPLHIVFHIALESGAVYSATLDSPDQGASGIPASTVKYTYPKLQMEWQGFGGVFEGKLENNHLNGTWRQGAMSLPLKMQRGTAE